MQVVGEGRIMTLTETTLARKKTKMMLEIEERFGRDITELLADLVTEYGLTETAEILGTSKANVGYWMLKLDILVKRVAVAPGDSLRVRRRWTGEVIEWNGVAYGDEKSRARQREAV